mmetsp:Transcript_108552/g.346487  ORF Transcript_108552/g.346487 Transcript_108552/m.346487 type:complete len:85 (+) Transcript_108552:242-496(+)
MDELATEHAGKATFLLVNVRGIDDAKQYKSAKSLTSPDLVHASGQAPGEYALKYIPHKVVIDKSGKVVKNFDGVDLAADVKSQL